MKPFTISDFLFNCLYCLGTFTVSWMLLSVVFETKQSVIIALLLYCVDVKQECNFDKCKK